MLLELSPMAIWSLVQGPLMTLVLGGVLALFALLLLRQYAVALRADPKTTMSVEVLVQVILSAGGPGYLAGFLFAAAAACLALALYSLGFNMLSYLSG